MKIRRSSVCIGARTHKFYLPETIVRSNSQRLTNPRRKESLDDQHYLASALAAPAPQQGGITPIRDPQACTPENKGGVFISFEDLPSATHVAEQYAPLGVHFVDNRVTTPLIYSNMSERDTSSRPNSLTNDADVPNTSASVPLTLTFDAPQSVVGFYLGNGPADGQTGALRSYDGGDSLLGSVPLPTISNDVTRFYGVSDSLARIQRIELDYGNTARSEEIDDLCFSRAQKEPQIRTFKGRVLQSGRLERPTPLPGVQVALYGSNNAAILGTLLSSATSAPETGHTSSPRTKHTSTTRWSKARRRKATAGCVRSLARAAPPSMPSASNTPALLRGRTVATTSTMPPARFASRRRRSPQISTRSPS